MLSGIELDRSVAVAQGVEVTDIYVNGRPTLFARDQTLHLDVAFNLPDQRCHGIDVYGVIYAPSLNWEQAGPIIQQHLITLVGHAADDWSASAGQGRVQATGATPLIAALRCYLEWHQQENVHEPQP